MTPDEYQEAAKFTAAGPNRQDRAIYGFYGEWHEMLAATANLRNEQGDVAWYLAEIATTHDQSLQSCIDFYEELVAVDGAPAINMSTLAEARKKHLRGDARYQGQAYLDVIAMGVGYGWKQLMKQIVDAGFDPAHVLGSNILRLRSRKERGVINGDGDNR